jgi:hypothetical protein
LIRFQSFYTKYIFCIKNICIYLISLFVYIMASNLGIINGVQSFLVESSRGQSEIDATAPEENNARWTTQSNLELKRGDRVSVECLAIESTGASNSGQTIEFSGKSIKIGDQRQNFTDDQVLLQFNFYMMNTGHNQINLPTRFNTPVDPFRPMSGKGPYKSNLQVNKGYWGGYVSNYPDPAAPLTEIPYGNGIANGGKPLSIPIPSDVVAPTASLNQHAPYDFQFPSCGFDSQEGYTFPGVNGASPGDTTAYGIEKIFLNGVIVPFPLLSNTVQFDEIQLCNTADGIGAAGVLVDYLPESTPMPSGALPYPAGTRYNNGAKNTTFAQGKCIVIFSGLAPGPYKYWWGPQILSVTSSGAPENRVSLKFVPQYLQGEIDLISYQDPIVSCIGPSLGYDDNNPDGSVKKYYGGYSQKPLVASAAVGANDRVGGDYNKGGRMGIGLYNQSATTGMQDVPAELFPTDKNRKYAYLRGGAALWEQQRNYGEVSITQSPQLGINTTALPAGVEPKLGLKTLDMRNYKDNNAYIMTRSDFQGPQPHPNGAGLSPDLEPMSAFVYVKAGSAFEDTTALAAVFTDAFHAINKLLTTQGDSLQKYIENAEYPFNKKNNIFPLFSEGYFDPIQPVGIPPEPKTFKKQALWSRVSPLFLGNMIKCLPANMDCGADWKYQEGSPYYYWCNDWRDYLKAGIQGDWCWSNSIYGNMGLKDFTKCRAGDKLVRLECWDGNTLLHPNRDIPRPVVLNTQLQKGAVTSKGPGTIFSLNSTYFNIGDTIFTNIQYENTGWEGMDGADINSETGYTGNATLEQIAAIRLRRYKNLDDIQLAMGEQEKYMIQGNPYAVNGKKNQQKQPWWIYGMDLGMSDGSVGLNAQSNAYSGGRFGVMTPIQTNWMPEAPDSAKNLVTAALVPPISAFAPAYNSDPANPQTLAEDIPAGWSWITPSQSVMGCGAEINYQQAKAMGNLNVFSRWNDAWNGAVFQPDGANIKPTVPPNSTYAPHNPYEQIWNPGSGAVWAHCRIYGTVAPYNWIYDQTESKNRNIGAFPYEYTDEDLNKHKLVAFVVAKEYNALNDTSQLATSAQTNTTGSWEMCDLNWGDFFGFSPQFGYDQPAIVPVNNDVIANENKVLVTAEIPGPPIVPAVYEIPEMKYKQNWVNSVWCGASDAAMVFNGDKNRFELGGLYTNNKLSTVNAPPLSGVPNPQVGERIATINGNNNDTLANLPYGTKQREATPEGLGLLYDWDSRNQGVEDCITGVCLKDVWLVPEGWVPPENLNPQNLSSPNIGNVAGIESATDYNPYSPLLTNPSDYVNVTAENYKNFTKDLTLATEANWSGTILDKMGFAYDQIIPYAGSQENRYSEWTYGKDNVSVQDEGVKPLMLNAELDTAATQVLNTYINRSTPPPLPPYGTVDDNGSTLYRTGQLNNTIINLSAINGATLTARDQPSLYSTPYYVIITDLVPTQFQKGKMKQNAIYYGLKSYSAGQYFYVYASGYSQLVQSDRLVQSISTELRNPLTGELSRVGKNSSIIYKVERDIQLPAITMTAEGEPIDQETAATEQENNNAILGEEFTRMFNEEKSQEKSLHSILLAETKRGDEGIDAGYLERLMAEHKKQLQPQKNKVLINQADNFGGGHHPNEHLETKGEGKRDDEGIAMERTSAERVNPADVEMDIVKMLIEKGLSRSSVTAGKSGNILNPFTINKSIVNIVSRYQTEISELVADKESGRLTNQELFEKVQDIGKNAKGHDFGIGVRGQVISRYKGGGAGHYRMDPRLLDAVAKDMVAGQGSGMLRLIKEGAIKDEIQVIKAGEGSGDPIPRTAEEVNEMRRKTRLESNKYKSMAAQARRAGVDRAILLEADNAAKRMADEQDPKKGKDYDDILARERNIALSNPVKYLRETAGGKVELSMTQKEEFEKLDIQGARRKRGAEWDEAGGSGGSSPRTGINYSPTSVASFDLAERIEMARLTRDIANARKKHDGNDGVGGGGDEKKA